MKAELTFEPGFDKLYQSFANDKIGIQLLDLDGISSRMVDVGQMSHDYFTRWLADTSANANEELSANNYQAEVSKGVLKLEGYYLLWRYAKKRFGIHRANKLIKAIWDGKLYFHDASGHGILVHREEILRRRIRKRFLKFFEPLKWFKLDILFSTIGIHGQYEMCHFMGLPMEGNSGQEFTENVLKRTDQYALEFSKETGHSFNTEEIPAESTAISLAKKDQLLYGDRQPFVMYSNQYIPLIADMDAIERVKLTGRFMKHISGGGILHLNIKDRIQNPPDMKKLILLALKDGVEHFAINYGFGICENGHTTVVGNGTVCPICGARIEDYLTRVIGYFTKISSWGDVRKNFEYPQRKFN